MPALQRYLHGAVGMAMLVTLLPATLVKDDLETETPAQQSWQTGHLASPTMPTGSGPVAGGTRPSLTLVLVQAQGSWVARSVPREAAQVTCEAGQPEAEQGSIIMDWAGPRHGRGPQRPRRATWFGQQGQVTMCPWTSPSLL